MNDISYCVMAPYPCCKNCLRNLMQYIDTLYGNSYSFIDPPEIKHGKCPCKLVKKTT